MRKAKKKLVIRKQVKKEKFEESCVKVIGV